MHWIAKDTITDYNFIRHNKHLMYFILAESKYVLLTQLVYVIFHDLSR